jgi:hypothetical protein
MAKSNAERVRESRGEVKVRFHCLSGTRQALAELMTSHGEEQGEAMTSMIHHLHGLGPAGSE